LNSSIHSHPPSSINSLINQSKGASFGPLDNQVVILNTDGESFTLLKAPQAMRLKKAGYIKDKRFVTQPTQEVIDDALEAPEGEGIGSLFKGLLGNSD
jgi:hypothetical protein